ncbi:MAG: 50S ribosomal protein L9 [Planctomycetota bacterium]
MKTIELLLLETVDNLGIVGDVVKVRPGFARNYLLPHGIAVAPSPEKVAELAERRKAEAARLAKLAEEQRAMVEKLEGYELTLERSANENGVLFGGVSQHEIAEALQAEGFAIDDRHVRIGDQIKRLDSYDIPVVVNKELKTEIKLWVVSDQPLEPDDDEDLPEDAPEGGGPDGEASDGEGEPSESPEPVTADAS